MVWLCLVCALVYSLYLFLSCAFLPSGQITVPPNSARWAINIGPADPSGLSDEDENEDEGSEGGAGGGDLHSLEPCDDWQNILFHFNPRYARRKGE